MSKPQPPESTEHVPADNVPGHHPEHEQDKPDVKVVAVPRGVRGGEEIDLDRFEAPDATIAGEALRAAAGAVRKVRESMPGG